MAKALIGAGCFWGVEEHFRNLDGVEKTEVGYSGGETINPSYADVCNGNTNHVEVVLVYYDEKNVKYDEILNNFWKCHDPTQLNRQGLDVGTQYRSVIFYYDNDQKSIAEKSKSEAQKNIKNKIVTEISKAKEFFRAEEYHQCFIAKKKL